MSCSPSDPPPIPVSWLPPPRPVPSPLSPPPTTPPPPEIPALPRPRPAASRLISGCVQHFAATPSAAGWARRHSADALKRWGVEEMTDDVCMVVSELVGNAVRHAVTPEEPSATCRLVLKLFVDVLSVEVWDPSPGAVAPVAQDDLLSESGRGLAIVDALCVAPPIAFDSPGIGKTIVAVLPRRR